MRTEYRGERGFTLVELMIVIAIIGVLAAIAIPSFLSYQLKSKTAEAKTNLSAIKTASLSFQAERSCFLSVQGQGWPGTIPINGAMLPWPQAAATPTSSPLCINPQTGAPGPAVGTFADIGFTPTGSVRYNYYLAAMADPTASPGPVTNSCPNWPNPVTAGATVGPTNGFLAQALSDLDGNKAVGGFMVSDASSVVDCAPNVF
jgi:type IV pilus assembly protein PilA